VSGISRSLLEFEETCVCTHNHTSDMDIFMISLLFSGTSAHFSYMKLKELVRSCVCIKLLLYEKLARVELSCRASLSEAVTKT